ncbi:acyltransferase family protein [Pseudomonas segetis]|uniref:Peptidoglycan/LPS O-acetylase OafA/YrhL, contains acyltransferase and SGNH-hydrolase domains n=1 Tax=Pseudomonas segetis TaxID=298908 RepID=A0A239C5Z7_9PSED|nr:acyltransferase [Pseudomonas segetis]SNS15667.1 Peptidoglycan/LPS O-acetylase OafA/YrhL, contains acyltransferase and SGNH-hydrolase domains [Pseudomonas segetis]
MRVHSIDYLRGAMASAVLLYHFASWSVGGQASDTVLGKLGIYAVSTFYIISGMSMFIAYRKSEWSMGETFTYLIKRFFRIAPLFAVATLSTILVVKIMKPAYVPDTANLIANLTLAFGFYAPTKYIATGGWSIGNEMVFYYFFPILALLVKRPALFAWAFIGTLGVYAFYAFSVLGTAKDIGSGWADYVHPANQGFLFLAGVALGKLYIDGVIIKQKTALLTLGLAAAAFVIYPASGNQISIVTGFNRLAFTGLLVAIVYSVACISINTESIAHAVMEKLGELSYSIYMLHGVIGMAAMNLIAPHFGITEKLDKLYLLLFGALPCTLIASLLVHKFIEMPAMKLAKAISPKRNALPASQLY